MLFRFFQIWINWSILRKQRRSKSEANVIIIDCSALSPDVMLVGGLDQGLWQTTIKSGLGEFSEYNKVWTGLLTILFYSLFFPFFLPSFFSSFFHSFLHSFLSSFFRSFLCFFPYLLIIICFLQKGILQSFIPFYDLFLPPTVHPLSSSWPGSGLSVLSKWLLCVTDRDSLFKPGFYQTYIISVTSQIGLLPKLRGLRVLMDTTLCSPSQWLKMKQRKKKTGVREVLSEQ